MSAWSASGDVGVVRHLGMSAWSAIWRMSAWFAIWRMSAWSAIWRCRRFEGRQAKARAAGSHRCRSRRLEPGLCAAGWRTMRRRGWVGFGRATGTWPLRCIDTRVVRHLCSTWNGGGRLVSTSPSAPAVPRFDSLFDSLRSRRGGAARQPASHVGRSPVPCGSLGAGPGATRRRVRSGRREPFGTKQRSRSRSESAPTHARAAGDAGQRSRSETRVPSGHATIQPWLDAACSSAGC